MFSAFQKFSQSLSAAVSNIVTDAYFNLVTLLLPGDGTNGAQNNTFLDSSSNNFTITRNGNTTQGTFSPFSQTGWGNYFDGSSVINVAASSGFSLPGDFTVECWVNYSSFPSSVSTWVIDTGSSTYFALNFVSATSLQVYLNSGSASFTATPATSVSLNVWNHVAVVRSGSTVTVYVNGVAASGTGTNSSTLGNSTNVFKIGGFSTTSVVGYVSNLRVTKGGALYTGTFTPSTTPLTTSVSSGTVSLLTCQSNRFVDNANSLSLSIGNGTPSVQAFSPFLPTTAYSAGVNGGSGYFDGSGDTLVTPTIGTSIGTGDYCLEGWVYTGSASTSFATFITLNNSAGYPIFLQTSANAARFLDFQNPGTNFIISGGTVNNNAWTHIVGSRQSGTVRLFVGGVLVANQTGVTFNYGTAGTATIASSIAEYLSGIRITIGSVPTAYQTSSTTNGTQIFAIPTAPPTAVTNTQLLLNFTNAGITDATSKNVLETVGNAQISTTQSKFGGSSMSFDGTGDWLLIPHTVDQMLGTGAFTIELWVYRNSSGTYGLVGKGTGTTGWLVSLNSSNQVVFTYGSSTITSSGTVSATTWTYIAVVREGTGTNQTKLYINGSNDGTGTVSTDFNQTNAMYVGADRTGGSAFNGYIDDLRITRGQARTVTTTPTSAFPLQ